MNSNQIQGRLLRKIGFVGIAILALNSIIGAGIFVVPAAVSARAGLLSPWLFLIVAILMIPIVLTFAELSSYFKDSGGPFLYTTTAFGNLAGFVTGWFLVISRMTGFAANTNILAIYLGDIFPWFGDGIGRSALITLTCVLLTTVNYVGVKSGIRTIGILTLLKLTPILILIVLGFSHVSGDTLFPGDLTPIEGLGTTLLLLVYPFIGIESATIVSGETKSPQSVMPRALVGTQIAIGALYFLVVLIYISVTPDAGESGATLIDVGRELIGPAGVTIMTLAAFFSIGGNLSSIMLAVPRLTFALSKHRLLPEWFGFVHHKYSTPSNSILLFGALGLVLALSGSFVFLAAASSLTRLIVYVLCISALPAIRRQSTPERNEHAFRLKGGYAIPAAALVLSLWVAMQSEWRSWLVTGALLLAGLVLYAVASTRRDPPPVSVQPRG